MHNNNTTFTKQQVLKTAQLSHISVTDAEARDLAKDFDETFEIIANLQQIDTSGVAPVHQLSNLENEMREDEVDKHHMLSQKKALSQAQEVYDGYFVVPAVLEEAGDV